MLLGALIDAGADSKIVESTIQLIPKYYSKCDSIHLECKEVNTHGFRACGVNFKISENPGEIDAKTFSDAIERIANSCGMSEEAASFAINSARLLVTTESQVHGSPLSDMHLHEAGSADTLADILGVAVACDSLGIFDGVIYATPVAVGGGVVSFSHGTVSSPAPAVIEIVRQRGIPIVGGIDPSELTTPTGITMMANLTSNFLTIYPGMVPEKVGYGAGTKELANGPNLLRVVIGKTGTASAADRVHVLETNLDDLSGEVLSYTLQRLLDSGAKDVWISSAQFKKNRPGHVLHVMCDPKDTDQFSRLIMEETGTLGVRYHACDRMILYRELRSINVQLNERSFEVRVKIARDQTGKTVRIKPEADDVQEIARTLHLPAREVARMIDAQI